SCPCRVDHSIGAMASSVGAICVGVRFLQIVTDGFNHLLRNLCTSGSIKKNGWLTVDSLIERRELRTNPIEVELGSLFYLRNRHGFYSLLRVNTIIHYEASRGRKRKEARAESDVG